MTTSPPSSLVGWQDIATAGGVTFAQGARVNWTFTPRGGYGFSTTAAAVVVSATEERIRIRAATRLAGGEWRPSYHNVLPQHLSPRAQHVPAVDDYEADPSS